MNIPIQRGFWYAKHYLSALGWPVAAAIILLTACTAFTLFTLKPLQQHIAALQQESITLRTQSRIKTVEQKNLDPAEQLAAFYRFFPKQESAPDGMAKLYNAAAQQNLLLEQGDYQLAHDRDSKLTRYDIVLPVKGGYVQVRKFIAQALTDVPNLSLDGITFNRQKIDDAAVEAQLQFTLYLSRD